MRSVAVNLVEQKTIATGSGAEGINLQFCSVVTRIAAEGKSVPACRPVRPSRPGFSALPAEPTAVVAFVDAQAVLKSPATVRRYIATIAHMHRAAALAVTTDCGCRAGHGGRLGDW